MLPNSRFVYAFKIGLLATFCGAIVDMFIDYDLKKYLFNPLFFASWMFFGYFLYGFLVKIIKR